MKMTASRWELSADLCAAMMILGVVAVYAGMERAGVALVILAFSAFVYVMPHTLAGE